ncbi:hypothetical protein HPP92_000761 [Vanilla planifolia]|uniref:Uncharacterized protein n=1 Tax=Vanilla planifolia TaxID=51239 RepID=A0A835RYQ1_VANPL|nr:hypothetical protein HPP92_000761 [Vanilla planifolia]
MNPLPSNPSFENGSLPAPGNREECPYRSLKGFIPSRLRHLQVGEHFYFSSNLIKHLFIVFFSNPAPQKEEGTYARIGERLLCFASLCLPSSSHVLVWQREAPRLTWEPG